MGIMTDLLNKKKHSGIYTELEKKLKHQKMKKSVW
jgi:hypothetical protein